MSASHAAGLRQACRWGAVLAAGIAFAVLSHWAAASPTPGVAQALVAVVPLLGLAFVLAWRSPRRNVMLAICVASSAALLGMGPWLVTHHNWVFLLEHAGIYALLCLAFGRTLQAGGTPMITGLARTVHGTLSPALISYTRSVTWAWSIYFAAITVASLLLFAFAPIAVWSAFANLVSPVLLFLMFAVEYAVRCCVLPAADRAGPIESIRAYRRASSRSAAPPS